MNDYPGAKWFTQAKCPNCHGMVEDLPGYLDSVQDGSTARINCPHCAARIKVYCWVTVDCYLDWDRTEEIARP